jgi:putative RNA 2'-phosphotransferase
MDYASLSKVISHALRHEPEAYGLTPDSEGWVSVGALIGALARQSPSWAALSESDLHNTIRLSAKRRHELKDGRIRALYGHSTSGRIEKQVKQPPEMLYHGTDSLAASLILVEGLKPMARQYAHLSADPATAQTVGMRKSRHPTILVVRAGEAWRSGVAFYVGNESVWLADHVPPAFISTAPEP